MDLGWYIKRLKAMGKDEILWRLAQKKLEKSEKSIFGKNKISVTYGVMYPELESLKVDPERLVLGDPSVLGVFSGSVPGGNRAAEGSVPPGSVPGGSRGAEGSVPPGPVPGVCPQGLSPQGSVPPVNLSIPGGFSYEEHKKDWHGGFQTPNSWPLAYIDEINYRQRDDIGDARTNWELNRHHQFVMLAARYAYSGDMTYLTELGELFSDWNDKNPFLWGIAWTSVMEVAIRAINWTYTLGFIALREPETEDETELLAILMESLSVGIINMISYVGNHFSRYSSANNHTIVEACALGIGGVITDYEPWQELSSELLFIELQNQNYKDGVNKEQALHYQSFVMEAVGLLILIRQQAGLPVPQLWKNTLVGLSRYLCWCGGAYGERIAFGDDDAGKIIDIDGIKKDHYNYVLQLMSLVLPEKYVDKLSDMTLMCITSGKMLTTMSHKPLFSPKVGGKVYPEGGLTILRSEDKRVLCGFDHGPLGYGSIAAHGHADALSIQIFREGMPLFADPGTYIYHINAPMRDLFRTTGMHNTMMLLEMDQSKMLGAFLWGSRAKSELLGSGVTKDGGASFYAEAEHDGYFPVIHRRRVVFDGKDSFILRDRILNVEQAEKGVPFELAFILGPDLSVGIVDDMCVICRGATQLARLKPESDVEFYISWDMVPYSREYGTKEETCRIAINGVAHGDADITTKIKVL